MIFFISRKELLERQPDPSGELQQRVAQQSADEKSLERLYDYTKFHIGVYLTLTTSYITLAVANIDGKPLAEIRPAWMVLAVLCFIAAGLAGGVIASSLTQQAGGSSEDFLKRPLGPYAWKPQWAKGRRWTYVEHTAFWAGLIFAIFSLVCGKWPACWICKL